MHGLESMKEKKKLYEKWRITCRKNIKMLGKQKKIAGGRELLWLHIAPNLEYFSQLPLREISLWKKNEPKKGLRISSPCCLKKYNKFQIHSIDTGTLSVASSQTTVVCQRVVFPWHLDQTILEVFSTLYDSMIHA